MKNYLITYDLNVPWHDYNSLYNEIKRYPCIHALESVWFVKSNGSASDISTHLVKFMDKNDRLIVSEITMNHEGWLDQNKWDFLKW